MLQLSRLNCALNCYLQIWCKWPSNSSVDCLPWFCTSTGFATIWWKHNPPPGSRRIRWYFVV